MLCWCNVFMARDNLERGNEMSFSERRKCYSQADKKSYGEYLNKLSADFYTAMYDLYHDNPKDHQEFYALGMVLGYRYV